MGKIKKILEKELGSTQSVEVYPVTSIEAVYDENNERLDNIIDRKDNEIKAELKNEVVRLDKKIDDKTSKINLPDDEDITSVDNLLKFANKDYSPTTYSGLGRVYLRKNFVDGKNVFTQDMISNENTIYIIQYDYDLNGATITIPNNCTLYFQGGSFSNGILNCNNTIIYGNNNCFNYDIIIKGTINNNTLYIKWFNIDYWKESDWLNWKEGNSVPKHNTDIINNHIQKFNIIIPEGIIPCDKPIDVCINTFILKRGINIQGEVDKDCESNSCLVFPNSSGFDFGPKRYCHMASQFKNLTIESKYACFNFNNGDLQTTDYPTLARCTFENLRLWSQQDDCFKSIISPNHYENYFHNIWWATDSEHGCFNHMSDLENIVDRVIDRPTLIGNRSYDSIGNPKPLYMFKNMGVNMIHCNLTNSPLKYIVYCDGSHANQHAKFIAKRCNFESITGPIIYSPNMVYLWCIDCGDDNIFVPDINPDEFEALFYCRINKIVNFPSLIFGKAPKCDIVMYGSDLLYSEKTLKVKRAGSETISYITGYGENSQTRVSALYKGNTYTCPMNTIRYSYNNWVNYLYLSPNTKLEDLYDASVLKHNIIYNDASISRTVLCYIPYSDATFSKAILGILSMSQEKLPNYGYEYGGVLHYCSTNSTFSYYIPGKGWCEYDKAKLGVLRSGTFEQKPMKDDIYVGFAYFCTDRQTIEGTTNGIIIYHKGNDVWVDALGRVIS